MTIRPFTLSLWYSPVTCRWRGAAVETDKREPHEPDHVCCIHPETEEKLIEDTTGQIGTSALFQRLGEAKSAYEASATGSE